MENSLKELFKFDEFEKFVFFNINQKAILKKIAGDFNKLYQTKSFLISQNNDLDSIILAQTRNDSLKMLDENYNNIYITYLPAREYSYLKTQNNPNEINHDYQKILNFNFDKILKVIESPLLKICNKEDFELDKINKNDDFLECILSGRRSSILFSEDSFALRLKGCGNNFNGFELGEVLSIGKNHFEIFGCQFKNTCLREQYVSETINKKLKESDFFSANLPVGFWKYDNKFKEKFYEDKSFSEGFIGNYYLP